MKNDTTTILEQDMLKNLSLKNYIRRPASLIQIVYVQRKTNNPNNKDAMVAIGAAVD
jgi:hypothetical protein